jgi:hypothetical protein
MSHRFFGSFLDKKSEIFHKEKYVIDLRIHYLENFLHKTFNVFEPQVAVQVILLCLLFKTMDIQYVAI